MDAACWGAAIGGAGYTANVAFSNGGFNNWNWGQFGKSVGIGAISGVVTAGIGNAFGAVGSNGIRGEIARAYTHGFANGMISEFSGGDFMSGFVSGGLGSLGGSAFSLLGGNFAQSAFGQISFSAISGGIGAELAGDDFWRGAATGATIGLLNHASATLGKVQRERIERLILKDGRLNLREANLWWELGEGADLTVDASKVDLDFLNPDGWLVGQKSSVQTLLSSRDGRVYGTLILKYLGNQQFMISPDTYDFPSGGSWFRNFANTIGRIYAGKGTGYTINFNGLNTVFHKWWRF